MKTIPLAWRIGSNRDTWLNNRGIPLYFIRITLKTGGQLRIGNITTIFKEEGGAERYYDGKYISEISDISKEINMLRGQSGGVSSMNSMTIDIDNGYYNGERFSDIYPLETFVNAKFELFLCFKDIDYSIDNSLKYLGRVFNYSYSGGRITFEIEEYSHLAQVKLPYRIEAFKEKYGLTGSSWTTPEKYKNKVVPINFGNITGKMTVITLPTTSNHRQIKFAIAHPISDVILENHQMVGWNPATKSWVYIFQSNRTETKYGTEKFHTMLLKDIANLPKVLKDTHYIRLTPDSIQEYTPAMGNPNAINDVDLSTEEKGVWTIYDSNVAYCPMSALTNINTYYNVWRIKFSRGGIPVDEIFNVHPVGDFIYAGQDEYPTLVAKVIPYNYSGGSTPTLISPNLTVDGAGGAKGRATFEVMRDYAEYQSYNRTIWEAVSVIGLHDTWENILADEWGVDFQVKRTDSITVRSWHIHEFYILIMQITPPIDYFATGEFGHNTVQDMIDMIWNWYIFLDSSVYVTYSNFARNYDIAGQVNEETDSHALMSKIANEFGLLFVEDVDGKAKFIDLNGKSADYNIRNQDLLDDNGLIDVQYGKVNTDIFSKFSVDYNLNIATDEYNKTKYIDKDNNNFTILDPTDLTNLCKTAEETYGSSKRMVVKLDFVRNDQVAEEILTKIVKLYAQRLDSVSIRSSLRLIDLEEGDQVTLICDDYTSDKNFFVRKKRINLNNGNIDWELVESPFGTTGGVGTLVGDLKEIEGLSEHISTNIGVPLKETMGMNEYIST